MNEQPEQRPKQPPILCPVCGWAGKLKELKYESNDEDLTDQYLCPACLEILLNCFGTGTLDKPQ